MKTIKKTILGILLIISLILLAADGNTFEDIMTSKMLFLLDAILIGYLWQVWDMDKYYKNLEED